MTDPQKRHDVLQETAKAKAAFLQYQALGPERSLEKLLVLMGKPAGNIRQVERWSSLYGWQARVKAYDEAELKALAAQEETERLKREEARREKARAEIERMNDTHARYGSEQAERAVKILKELADSGEISAGVAVSLLRLAVEIERNARGEGAQKLEVTGADGGPIRIVTEWGTFKPVEDKE